MSTAAVPELKESRSHSDDASHSSNLKASKEESFFIDSAAERRAVRLVDYSVLPIMTMYYLLSFLDRANIGNARVAGLQKQLGMTDHQYQVAVTVLFVPYICAELPANLLLRKVGPRRLMPTLLTIWGTMVTLQGLVSSYGGLVTVRALLGLVEGPMFPGITLYLSGFYTREELSLRLAIFFSAASLSGAFSGLLAAAIQNMEGVGGKPGWAWIFILEGLFSVLVGITGYFVTPSTPRECRLLSEEQKDLIMRRLEKDRPAMNPLDHFSFKEIIRCLQSPHVIFCFLIFFMQGTTLYGLANFSPSIINQLGYSPVHSQLLSVGPFAGGFVATLGTAYFSDKYKRRGIPAAAISLLSIIGFSVYLTAKTKRIAYGSLYLTIPGIYAGVPIVAAWMSNNSEPHYRRATAIAIGFVATNSGGILSTWRFPTKEGPKFTKTTIMDIVFMALVVVFALTNATILSYKNKRKAQNRDKLLAPYADQQDGDMRAWVELGDRHPDFRYAI